MNDDLKVEVANKQIGTIVRLMYEVRFKGLRFVRHQCATTFITVKKMRITPNVWTTVAGPDAYPQCGPKKLLSFIKSNYSPMDVSMLSGKVF